MRGVRKGAAVMARPITQVIQEIITHSPGKHIVSFFLVFLKVFVSFLLVYRQSSALGFFIMHFFKGS